NRFTPPPSAYPITLQTISIFWPGPANNPSDQLVGKTASLFVYQDADGDGNPANATLIGGPFNVTIGVTNTFQTFPVNLVAPGPGDIYLGFEDTWAESGAFQPRQFPAAI